MSKSDTGTDGTSTFGGSVLETIGLGHPDLEEDDAADDEAKGVEDEAVADDAATETGEETAAETVATEQKPNLPLDQVFEILKNRRRREVLHYLDDNGGTATLSDLAEHIAALENDTTVAAISSSQRKRVYVGLYQCHLPKMDDMDIVDFEQNRGTIELAQNADQLEQYLQDRTPTRNWALLYFGLAAAAGVLFIAARLGLASVGLTPPLVLAGLIVGVICCAGWQINRTNGENE